MKFIHAFLVIQFYFPFSLLKHTYQRRVNYVWRIQDGRTVETLTRRCKKSLFWVHRKYTFRVRLFWVKMISGNHFHPFPHVWLSQKMILFEKWLPVDQYFHLWPGNDFLPSFSLQSISGKRERERERGRARARERGEETEQSVDLQAAPISSSSSRRRDLAKIAISCRRELAP